VLIGSRDRENPLETSGANCFYMFKDRATGPINAITEADLV
jgi:hypothetical protein